MPRLISGELIGHSSTGRSSWEANLKYPAAKLALGSHLQARTVAVIPGRRGMQLNFALQFELGDAVQIFAQNLFLDFELMLVGGVLVVASAATGEIGAGRRDAVRRGFDYGVGVGASEAGFLLR